MQTDLNIAQQATNLLLNLDPIKEYPGRPTIGMLTELLENKLKPNTMLTNRLVTAALKDVNNNDIFKAVLANKFAWNEDGSINALGLSIIESLLAYKEMREEKEKLSLEEADYERRLEQTTQARKNAIADRNLRRSYTGKVFRMTNNGPIQVTEETPLHLLGFTTRGINLLVKYLNKDYNLDLTTKTITLLHISDEFDRSQWPQIVGFSKNNVKLIFEYIDKGFILAP